MHCKEIKMVSEMIIFSSLFGNNDIQVKFEFDEYIPFSVATHEGLLGAKYLRLGDFERNLLEIMLDPISFTVRGLTLVCFSKLHVPMELRELPVQTGLPVVDLLNSELTELAEKPWAELKANFTLGIGLNFLELDLFEIVDADNIIRQGQLEFYCRGKALIGLRLNGLLDNEIAALQEHMTLINKD